MDKILKLKAIKVVVPIVLLILGFGTNAVLKKNQNQNQEGVLDNKFVTGSIEIKTEIEEFDEKAKELPTDMSEIMGYLDTNETTSANDSSLPTIYGGQSNSTTTSGIPQINYSSLSGVNLKIEEGSSFNPSTDLKVKAIDRNGADITSKVQFSGTVDVNQSGVYSIIAKVTLSDNTELVQTFYVEVLAKPLKVSVTNVQLTQQHIELGESFTLTFNVESSKQTVIPVAATVNGTKYPVNKGAGNQFIVELPGIDVGGKQTLTLNSIEMNEGTTILVNQKQDITILKLFPTITKSLEKFNPQTGVMEVGFQIVDEQSTINRNKSMIIALYDQNDNQVYKVSRHIDTLSHFLVTVPKNGEYTLKVFGYMNRDYTNSYELAQLYEEDLNITQIDKSSLTGQDISIKEGEAFDPIKDLQLKATNEEGEDITSTIHVEHSVNTQVPGTYEVIATIIKNNGEVISEVYKVEVTTVVTELKVNRFEPVQTNINAGSNVTLELEVSLSKDYLEVDFVEIDGNNYSVQKINHQTYQVTVPVSHTIGQDELNLSKVILSNHEEFVVNNKCQVTVTHIVTYTEPIGLMLTEEPMTRSTLTRVSQGTTQGQVAGDDKVTYSSELKLTGTVYDSNNQTPEGQISVALPTSVSFTVNADGTVITPTDLEIKNSSSCDVDVTVSKFTDSTPKDGEGITLVDMAGLANKNRSYVSLILLPQSGLSGGQVELLSSATAFTSRKLVTVEGGATTRLSLVGQAGSEKDDSSIENGVTDTFTLTFTIAKRK